MLVPYFRAGIEGNELCVWITSGPPGAGEAGKAPEQTLPGFEEFIGKGRIEIIPRAGWFDETGNTRGRGIESKVDQAILGGFEGLRLACDVPPEWIGDKAFPFDQKDVINRCNVITVFSYPRDRFDAAGLMRTVRNYRFALVRNTDRWELIESSEVGTIQDALKRSEEKLHSLFSNMSEGFAYHRIVLDAGGSPCDYVFQEVNSAFERLTGLKAENILGKKATEALPGIEKDPFDWIGRYGRVALTGTPEKFESYSALLGKWFSVSAFSPHRGYFAVTFSDITERKHAEEALRESEERWAVTLSSIGDAVIATDTEGRIAFLNKVAEELTGWRLAEAAGMPVREVFHIVNEHTRAIVEDPVRKVLQTRMIVGLANHTLLIRKDGGEVPIDDSGAPIRDHEGRVLGAVLVFRDITARRRAEEALRRSESRWNAAIESFAEGAIIVAEDERVIYWNPAARSMHGFARPDEGTEPLEKILAVFQLWTPDGGRMLEPDEWPVRRLKRGEAVRDLELRVRRPDQGWEKVFRYTGAMVDTAGGERMIFLTCRDLTPIKLAEEALKASLSEKEVLLKEIHHRVKNNLQVVSSLLELQAGQVRDAAVRGIFQDVNGRVRSMAMVHEKLYQSTDLARVDFADYAQSLLGHLWKAQGPSVPGIALDLDLNPVWLPVNAAVPCGLILNELFANALKHAFRGRSSGRVAVSLCEDAGGTVSLSVCDDGVGLPPEVNWEQSRSLGLRIVKTLARQLHARIEVRNGCGTRFTILFER